MAKLTSIPKTSKKAKKRSQEIADIMHRKAVELIKEQLRANDIFFQMEEAAREIEKDFKPAKFEVYKLCLDEYHDLATYTNLMQEYYDNPEKFIEFTKREYSDNRGKYYVVISFFKVIEEDSSTKEGEDGG